MRLLTSPKIVVASVLLPTVVSSVAGYAATLYQPTVLGALDHPGFPTSSTALGINEFGQVAARSYTNLDASWLGGAMIWQPDAANSSTGTLLSWQSLTGHSTRDGLTLNDAGAFHASGVTFTPGSPNSLSGTASSTVGHPLANNLGQVVYNNKLFLPDGAIIPLGISSPLAFTSAGSLNNRGQFIATRGSATYFCTIDSAAPSGVSATLLSGVTSRAGYPILGDGGVLAFQDFAGYEASLWVPATSPSDPGHLVDLNALLGMETVGLLAIDITGRLLISGDDRAAPSRILQVRADGSFQLEGIAPTSGWTLPDGTRVANFYASDMNDAGQLVGDGDVWLPGASQPRREAILLTPIPEPAGIGLSFFAASFFAARRRRT